MNPSPSLLSSLLVGTVSVLPLEELERKLASGKKLIIKLGADPTAPDLHLGHAVVLNKLKQFQELGHTIVFLIGDFTARIGDPTGRSKTRPPLSDTEIATNSKTYLAQVGRILDLSRVTIRYNSEWLTNLTSTEWVTLCAKVTLARLIEREDFAQRLQEYVPIGFHELLYPLMQGYDSVALAADIELGGTDQTFNLFMGRFLQEQFGMEPQVIMTTPLLEGINGTAKMSKSLGNTIALNDSADQAYGKLMSISDTLMWHYAEVLLMQSDQEREAQQRAIAEGDTHPLEIKKGIAHAIVTRFWGEAEADHAQSQFEKLFQHKEYAQAPILVLPSTLQSPVWIVDLVKIVTDCTSSSQARRLVEAGAVSIDGLKIMDCQAQISITPGMVVKAGKHRMYRVELPRS